MTLRLRTRLFVVAVLPLVAGAVALDVVLGSLAESEAIADGEEAVGRVAGAVALDLQSRPATDGASMQAALERVGAAVDLRLTLLDRAGRVLADTGVEAGRVATLPSHADRPEVIEALAGGDGRAIRRSETVGIPLLYVARTLDLPEGPRVLRLAWPLGEADRKARARRWTVAAVMLPVLLLVALVAWGLAARQDRRLHRMADAAGRMAAGDFAVSLDDRQGDDLSVVARALNHLADASSTTFQRLETEGRLVRSILETMQEGVMAVDRDGRITLVNDGMMRLAGFHGGAAGLAPGEVIHAPELLEAIDEALTGASVSRELSVTQPRTATLLVNAAPLADGEGALVVVHDTTELHRLHQMRRDFVANVSHELRNPVAIIQAAVETLGALAEDKPADPDERRLLESISRQAARMAALVRDLLGLARVESGQLVLEPVALRLADTLSGILSAFEGLARQRGITLGLAVDPAAPAAVADPSALHTVVGNLLDNAVKYSRPGDRVEVRVREAASGQVLIEVSDTGPGIAAEHLPRLFERFYRVDPGRSREGGGTGLGLALVKHLSAAMGGAVTVRSEVGAGTTFTVTLPAAPVDHA